MIPIDTDYLVHTLADLVRINSVNPALSPGGQGEAEICAYTAQAMQALGLQATIHDLSPGRANVVGLRKGSGRGRSLMWNAHLDTVGVEGMKDNPGPFSGEVRNERLYGRGSQDMKGSLAAMLAAVKALKEAGVELAGNLILTGVADEEWASLGTEDILRRYHADAAIVTEPTDLCLGLAHRGFIAFEVETFGKAAHGSRYDEGIDAIIHMGRFLSRLDQLEQTLRQRQPHPLAGPPSLHASTIQGGDAISIYPAHCRLEVEWRSVPGESLESATQELQAIIDQLSRLDSRFKASMRPTLSRAPFEVSEKEPIVQSVQAAMSEVLQAPPRMIGASFWTDAALFSEAGIPSVLVGPTGGGLHSAEEWVDVNSCVELARILALATINFCSG
jgi:acetylornithine deacetylase